MVEREKERRERKTAAIPMKTKDDAHGLEWRPRRERFSCNQNISNADKEKRGREKDKMKKDEYESSNGWASSKYVGEMRAQLELQTRHEKKREKINRNEENEMKYVPSIEIWRNSFSIVPTRNCGCSWCWRHCQISCWVVQIKTRQYFDRYKNPAVTWYRQNQR